VNCLAYSPDGQTLATGSSDRRIKLWDARTDQEKVNLSGHSGFVYSLAFSPDGRILVSVAGSEVKLWDVGTAQELMSLAGHTGAVYCAAFSPDGQTLATAGASANGKGEIKFWRAPGPRPR
jgi:WD40 repeat protein